MKSVEVRYLEYSRDRGVVIGNDGEAGNVEVTIRKFGVEILGDALGLRELARWCMALADERAPDHAHIHLDAGTEPLTLGSASLMLGRQDTLI